MTTATKLVSHPAADFWPLMSEDELKALADDIKENGQRLPIFADHEGRIVDGRNRWKACEIAGVEPVIEEYSEESLGDVASFVASMNEHRRHMTKAQRREIIRKLRAEGKSTREIAKAVGVHHSTVADELKVDSVGNQTLPIDPVEAVNHLCESSGVDLPDGMKEKMAEAVASVQENANATKPPPPPKRLSNADRELILRQHDSGMKIGDIAVKLWAERRAGEILRETAESGERRKQNEGTRVSDSVSLSDLGISRVQSSRWQMIAEVPEQKSKYFESCESVRISAHKHFQPVHAVCLSPGRGRIDVFQLT